jgi:tRNA pseudouridine38-40 synthase
MKKYALILSYLGTDYCGWQKQRGSAAKGAISIQETIEKAVEKMTTEKVSIVGSGRTDAGVHATAQVAHITLRKKEWPPEILKRGLNSLLPSSIRVVKVVPVEIEFHAQRSAEKKQYSYYFLQATCSLPHLETTSRWIQKTLDVKAMQKALKHLKGRHDFLPFRGARANEGSAVREILEADITCVPLEYPMALEGAHFIRVRVVGTGFLKQMVRGIAGTLLQVGEGKRDPDCMLEILKTKDRKKVGPTAPARALWLERVWYPGQIPS